MNGRKGREDLVRDISGNSVHLFIFSKFSYISIYFRLENSNRLTYTDQGSNSRNLSNSHKAAASSGATSTAPSSAGMPQRMSPFDELMAQHQQQIIRERQLLRIASAREARIGGGQTSSQGGGGTSSHVGGHSSESFPFILFCNQIGSLDLNFRKWKP